MYRTWIAHAPLCAALLAGGCSSDSPPALLDAGAGADAAAQAACLIPSDYSTLPSKTGTADSPSTNSLTVTLDAGPPRDVLFLQLKVGSGAFAGGALKPGVFPITGAEASRATCGLCVSIIADIVTGQGPTKFYFATSGTVTLTTATAAGSGVPSKITGSATNLQFIEDDGAGTPASSGCSSKIASIGFSS